MTLPLGPIGLWTFNLDRQPMARAQRAARQIEKLGYSAIWVPEATNRNPFVNCALLLSATRSIVLATGIAPIYNRDAMATATAQNTLCEAFPDRFLLGLGVSHQFLVEDVRGGSYVTPLATMRRYLEQVDAAPYTAVPPTGAKPRVIAALGPKMLALSAELADGAHPYNVTPEHTARAREIIGPGKILAPDQKVVLEADPKKARKIGRDNLGPYLAAPNYRNSLKRQGFTDDDFERGGSDRLIDGVIGWGTTEKVVARVNEHLQAGADHVAVQVLTANTNRLPMKQWTELAAAFGLSAPDASPKR